MKTIQPLNNKDSNPPNAAADLIRSKLSLLYDAEPDAKDELKEADAPSTHHSKHQFYMHELGQSGKSLAEIQTAWHNYYIALPDDEKHQVWQEFYQEHDRRNKVPAQVPLAEPLPEVPIKPAEPKPKPYTPSPTKNVSEIKDQLLRRVRTRSKQKGGHIKSLLFGLSSGLIVIVILLFSFFNEKFIAPFISPSKTVSDTQIIIDPNSAVASNEPKIIIPKINAELPVIYTEPSIDEKAVQNALQDGVLHYGTTPNPGELGNGTIFGHSSNNILNKGKYKFAFVLLNRLENGDTFIIQKDGKRYVYRIFDKKVVKPEDVSILSDSKGKPATFSLVTCDPPGTSINRLVVTGEQITPDPMSNVASSAPANQAAPRQLPGNAPSLWKRLTGQGGG